MAANPMTQFEVYRIGPEIKVGAFDISFTNSSLFMVISSLAILIIFNLGSKKNYAMHWGTFSLTDEDTLEPPRLLQEALSKKGLSPSFFEILKPGQLKKVTLN